MAHFYAEIHGNRGEASRMGTKKSGMFAHARGWNIGARISCTYNSVTGKDMICVYSTGGSTGSTPDMLIATLIEK